uniref:BPTI/Kunitz inhibitor domain-containing protein n=1 Tax=Gadus morhua TaxID=8049 RepID=A0A8C5C2R5_GADMO
MAEARHGFTPGFFQHPLRRPQPHYPPSVRPSVCPGLGVDRCLEPMLEGGCSEYVLLWYFHRGAGDCRPFVYGGCAGNLNRFPTRRECQKWCPNKTLFFAHNGVDV